MARKTYSEESRRDAVDFYATTDGATVKQIAADLGITDATLSAWLKTAGVAPLPLNSSRSFRQSTAEASARDS